MNNDEQKKKIVKILQELRASKPFVPNDYGLRTVTSATDREIAGALIAAGIGDVKETERKLFISKDETKFTIRRAEVLERALDKACECIANTFNPSEKRDSFKQHYVKVYTEQAEKELSEEGKR